MSTGLKSSVALSTKLKNIPGTDYPGVSASPETLPAGPAYSDERFGHGLYKGKLALCMSGIFLKQIFIPPLLA
jgi:hypothetical protein